IFSIQLRFRSQVDDGEKTGNPIKVGRWWHGIIRMNPAAIGSGLGMSLGKFSDGTNPLSIRKCIIIETCHQFSYCLPNSPITHKSDPLSKFLTIPQLV